MLHNLLNTLKAIYSKPFKDIQLHRDMIGYVCIVTISNKKYVLKLFRSNHKEQAKQSIQIMRYLYEAGFPTANIIPTSDGMLYFTLDVQGESRIGVLYDYITGTEPDKERDIEAIGKQTGRLHHFMQKYQANLLCHEKPFFIDRYINILNIMEYPKTGKFKEYGDTLWSRVKSLPRGFCHGDYHTGNMLLNARGEYVLFDFDVAADAFPAYDIAVLCDMTDYFNLTDHAYGDTIRMVELFMKGYCEHISMSEMELRHIPDLIAIRHFECQATIIENLGVSCVDWNFIDSQYEWLMRWEELKG